MRSTWVRTIHLQQYRLSCSSSRASLDNQPTNQEGATGSKWKRKKERSSGFAESVVTVTDVPFGHVFCQEVEIGVPFVANDFPAREAADGDNLRNGGESGA